MLMLATAAPAIFYFAQRSIVLSSSLNLKHSGSNLLFRIGIDGLTNVHHGGLLAAMQFLGGNRASLCFQAAYDVVLGNAIMKFNCVASIFGVVAMSLVGIFGYL